jgi:SPP1 gp7 family putative phage head morphogenesis protein
MPVNDELLDALTRHEVYLRRFGSATLRKTLAALKRSDARIIARLQADDISELSRGRQEALLASLRKIIQSAYTDATGALQLDLDGLAVYEADYQTALIKRIMPVKFGTVTPSPEQLIAAVRSMPFQGKILKEVYPELAEATFRQVRDAIRGGFIEGRTTGQIIKELRDNVLQKTRRDVEAVVRTAVNHTANAARELQYEANSDLVKGVRFNATLDSRTTLVCAGNDGKIFPPGEGPRPPLHFNCRSSTSPVLKSWRELGFDIDELPASTRASMDGQVPADLTYDGWMRKQDKEFQDGVLGPGRADLFRDGLKIDQFTDASGAEYTLDQLRKREG